MEFAANCCSSRCTEVKASPDEALTESTNDVAPAMIMMDLQAVNIDRNIYFYFCFYFVGGSILIC